MSQMSPPPSPMRNRAASRKERSRTRILESAARLFKSHGYNGIGLMAIMNQAGLTPGAFYAHFQSKEHLFAEVVGMELEFNERLVRARGMFSGEPARALAFALDHYMGREHIEEIFSGCILASLTADIARANEAVRGRFERELVKLFDDFATILPYEDEPERIDNAIAALALAAGGVAMAKAVADEELSARILAACRQGTRRLTGEAADDMKVGASGQLD